MFFFLNYDVRIFFFPFVWSHALTRQCHHLALPHSFVRFLSLCYLGLIYVHCMGNENSYRHDFPWVILAERTFRARNRPDAADKQYIKGGSGEEMHKRDENNPPHPSPAMLSFSLIQDPHDSFRLIMFCGWWKARQAIAWTARGGTQC